MIGDDLAGIEFFDNSSFRNLDIDIVAVLATAVFLTAFLAVSGFIFSNMSEIGQGI